MLDTNKHTFNVNISNRICQILFFSTVYKRKRKEGREGGREEKRKKRKEKQRTPKFRDVEKLDQGNVV